MTAMIYYFCGLVAGASAGPASAHCCDRVPLTALRAARLKMASLTRLTPDAGPELGRRAASPICFLIPQWERWAFLQGGLREAVQGSVKWKWVASALFCWSQQLTRSARIQGARGQRNW